MNSIPILGIKDVCCGVQIGQVYLIKSFSNLKLHRNLMDRPAYRHEFFPIFFYKGMHPKGALQIQSPKCSNRQAIHITNLDPNRKNIKSKARKTNSGSEDLMQMTEILSPHGDLKSEIKRIDENLQQISRRSRVLRISYLDGFWC